MWANMGTTMTRSRRKTDTGREATATQTDLINSFIGASRYEFANDDRREVRIPALTQPAHSEAPIQARQAYSGRVPRLVVMLGRKRKELQELPST